MKNGGVKLFQIIFIFPIFIAAIVFSGVQAFGDKWTAAQKQVWARQEEYYERWRKGDFDGLLAMSHSDYTVWPCGSESPVEKREHIWCERVIANFS